jgi:hypothetical protein
METMITNNICKTAEYEDSVVYKAICACTDSYHDQTLWVEYNKEVNHLELTIYSDLIYPDWDEDTWLKKIWKRVKTASKLLFTGEIEISSSFLFDKKESIQDYIKALKEGMNKVENNDIRTKVY